MEENQNNNLNQDNLNQSNVENQNNIENQNVNMNNNVSTEPVVEELDVDEEKPKKGFGFVIALLVIIIVALLGVIVYDKVINKPKPPISYNVTFDPDGGRPAVVEIVNNGQTVNKPSDPYKIGYKFVEWQLDGKSYDFSTPITSNITLKAIWQAEEKYFAIKSVSKEVDGKMLDISFPFYVDYYTDPNGDDTLVDDEDEYPAKYTRVLYDIYVNDKKLGTVYVYGFEGEEYMNLDYLYGKGTMDSSLKEANDYINSIVENVASNDISVIKDSDGGKSYLYIHKGKQNGIAMSYSSENLWILDSDLNVISKDEFAPNANYLEISLGGQYMSNPKDCNEKFAPIDNKPGSLMITVYDGEDGIHYLEMSAYDSNAIEDEEMRDSVDEKVVFVKNGQMEIKTVKTCKAVVEGAIR